jgi:hypothetical protein
MSLRRSKSPDFNLWQGFTQANRRRISQTFSGLLRCSKLFPSER